MGEWSLKYLTTLTFSTSTIEHPTRPAVFNAWGWPEEPERSSRIITFTEDNAYGAFLFSPKDVILFTVSHTPKNVEPRYFISS